MNLNGVAVIPKSPLTVLNNILQSVFQWDFFFFAEKHPWQKYSSLKAPYMRLFFPEHTVRLELCCRDYMSPGGLAFWLWNYLLICLPPSRESLFSVSGGTPIHSQSSFSASFEKFPGAVRLRSQSSSLGIHSLLLCARVIFLRAPCWIWIDDVLVWVYYCPKRTRRIMCYLCGPGGYCKSLFYATWLWNQLWILIFF